MITEEGTMVEEATMEEEESNCASGVFAFPIVLFLSCICFWECRDLSNVDRRALTPVARSRNET